MTIVYILVYLLGCLLAFGRFTASFYEIDERYINFVIPKKWWSDSELKITGVFIVILSWLGVLIGIIIYFIHNEEHFFKFSYKDLNHVQQDREEIF